MQTKELLIEILTEELPALPFLRERPNLPAKWEQALAQFSISIAHDSERLSEKTTQNLQAPYQIHFTPRRIAIISRAFPAYTDSITQEIFGAPVAMAFIDGDRSKGLSKAGEGFCKKIGLDPSAPESIAALQSTQKDGKEVLYYRKVIEGIPSERVLGDVVASFVRSLHFGKTMRWGDEHEGSGAESFIRPIRNIMILLGGLPIIARDRLDSTDSSAESCAQKHESRGLFGQQGRAATLLHRSFAISERESKKSSAADSANCAQNPAPSQNLIPWVQILGVDDYLDKLARGGVILDAKQREQRIIEQIKTIEREQGVQVELDQSLLDQIVAITEYPTALLGSFDQRFLALPEEVIITSMKEHQRYFGVYKGDKLFHGFIVVANALCDEFSAIISGNERVLKARLSDAEFFYHNDKSTPLSYEPLSQIAFVDGLGSMLDKTNRERTIGAYLAKAFGQNPAEAETIDTAIAYSKADLLSEMVGEFPELEGIMGYYYAFAQGFSPEVAQAIKEQYLPSGLDSAMPSSRASAIVALSGKLDSLLGLFSIGKLPSGSKDPYALRRAANGVVKIALEWELDFALDSTLRELAHICGYSIDEQRLGELQGFITERLESILQLSPLIFRSIAKGLSSSICAMAENAKALESLLKRDDREALVAVFKRVANITKDIRADELTATDSRIDSRVAGSVDSRAESRLLSDMSALLAGIDESALSAPEKALYDRLCEIDSAKCAGNLARSSAKLEALFSLRGVLEEFFAQVLVNDENPALRKNRKSLLYAIYAEFCTIGDLKELAI